jgi:hypothetical protein
VCGKGGRHRKPAGSCSGRSPDAPRRFQGVSLTSAYSGRRSA